MPPGLSGNPRESGADHTGRSRHPGEPRYPEATAARDGLADRSPGRACLRVRADCRPRSAGMPRAQRAGRPPAWANEWCARSRAECSHQTCRGVTASTRGRGMQHRQHRRDADTGTDEHDGRHTVRKRERTARSADLHVTASPDALVEKTACKAVLVLDANPIVWVPRWTAQRIVPRDGGSIRVRPHADQDILAR